MLGAIYPSARGASGYAAAQNEQIATLAAQLYAQSKQRDHMLGQLVKEQNERLTALVAMDDLPTSAEIARFTQGERVASSILGISADGLLQACVFK